MRHVPATMVSPSFRGVLRDVLLFEVLDARVRVAYEKRAAAARQKPRSVDSQ